MNDIIETVYAKHPLLARRNAKLAANKAKTKNTALLRGKYKSTPIKSSPNWFQKLSAAAQKEYIAKHPNSKYAKGNGSSKPKSTVKPKATKAKNQGSSFEIQDALKIAQSDLKYWNNKLKTYKTASKQTMAKEAIARIKKRIKSMKAHM